MRFDLLVARARARVRARRRDRSRPDDPFPPGDSPTAAVRHPARGERRPLAGGGALRRRLRSRGRASRRSTRRRVSRPRAASPARSGSRSRSDSASTTPRPRRRSSPMTPARAGFFPPRTSSSRCEAVPENRRGCRIVFSEEARRTSPARYEIQVGRGEGRSPRIPAARGPPDLAWLKLAIRARQRRRALLPGPAGNRTEFRFEAGGPKGRAHRPTTGSRGRRGRGSSKITRPHDAARNN